MKWSKSEEDKYCIISFICGIKSQTCRKREEKVVARGTGVRETGDVGIRAQIFSEKMNWDSWYLMYSMVTIVENIVLYT